jgi:hypothetical protein
MSKTPEETNKKEENQKFKSFFVFFSGSFFLRAL